MTRLMSRHRSLVICLSNLFLKLYRLVKKLNEMNDFEEISPAVRIDASSGWLFKYLRPSREKDHYTIQGIVRRPLMTLGKSRSSWYDRLEASQRESGSSCHV